MSTFKGWIKANNLRKRIGCVFPKPSKLSLNPSTGEWIQSWKHPLQAPKKLFMITLNSVSHWTSSEINWGVSTKYAFLFFFPKNVTFNRKRQDNIWMGVSESRNKLLFLRQQRCEYIQVLMASNWWRRSEGTVNRKDNHYSKRPEK